MAELEQGLEELKVVKQAFKDNFDNEDVSTNNVEFRNMPNLLKQMEKKLPNQTKSVEPTKYPQIVKADDGYKLEAVGVREIPSQYIIPTGTKEITENNEYDVTQYSKVKVQVANAGTGTGGNPKFSQLIDGTIESLEESDLSEPNRIKDYTFYYCTSLTSAVIPSNITSIGASAFEGCSSLQTLVMADGVQSIGASAFKGINASAINIPTTLSVLESEVFANNTALNTITIPANIVEIKDNVFNGCTNLTEITMENTTPIAVTENTFPANVTSIYVKYSAYDAYIANWTAYADKIVRLPAIPSTIIVTINNYLGELVSGANVTITGNEQTFTGITNEQGVFTQGDLQPAIYTIAVSDLDGFKTPSASEVIVQENTTNNVVMTYEDASALISFADADWETISEISNDISINNMTEDQILTTYGWKVGDTKSYALTTGEYIEMRIIDFNHDDKYDGSGKAGLTIQLTHCLQTPYVYYTSLQTTGIYWGSSSLFSSMQNILKTIPTEMRNVIKTVNKQTSDRYGVNTVSSYAEQIFLLSEIEAFGTSDQANNGDREGYQYKYWQNKTEKSDRIMNYDTDDNGTFDTASTWWLRSVSKKNNASACAVWTSGGITYTSWTTSNARVSFAFCI